MAANQKKRTTKTSHGVHGGGGKVRLNELQKVLLGGGVLARPAAGSKRPKKR